MYDVSVKSDKVYLPDGNGLVYAKPIPAQITIRTDSYIRATKKIKERGLIAGQKMYTNATTGETCLRYRGGKNWLLCGYVLNCTTYPDHTVWQVRT